jgi:hypothetical protein
VSAGSLSHGCTIRSHHLPVPHVLEEHLLIPRGWQVTLYGEVRVPETVKLCPTHHRHAHLAVDAAAGAMCFGLASPFDRRQFGRELWGWAEEAGLWLRTRLDGVPAGEPGRWRTAGEPGD